MYAACREAASTLPPQRPALFDHGRDANCMGREFSLQMQCLLLPRSPHPASWTQNSKWKQSSPIWRCVFSYDGSLGSGEVFEPLLCLFILRAMNMPCCLCLMLAATAFGA